MSEVPEIKNDKTGGFTPKNVLKVVLLVILVSLLGVIVLIALGRTDDGGGSVEPISKANISCSKRGYGEIFEDALAHIESSDNDALGGAVEEIMARDDFMQNSDCLIVAAAYYTRIGDVENARKHLDLLLEVYDPEILIADGLYGLALNVENVKGSVERLEQRFSDSAEIDEDFIPLYEDGDDDSVRGDIDYDGDNPEPIDGEVENVDPNATQ